MKQPLLDLITDVVFVAPLAGAWIETEFSDGRRGKGIVAPLAGAWIETISGARPESRGTVAPLAGVWIETPPSSQTRRP